MLWVLEHAVRQLYELLVEAPPSSQQTSQNAALRHVGIEVVLEPTDDHRESTFSCGEVATLRRATIRVVYC